MSSQAQAPLGRTPCCTQEPSTGRKCPGWYRGGCGVRARGGRWGAACSSASRGRRRRGPVLLRGRVPLLSEPGFLAECDLCLVGSCPVPRGPGAPASAHWQALPSRSGGHFLSTAERIRLPDDCTIGYIVEALLGVPLIRSGLFHSHLENLQQVPASELHKQVRRRGGPGRAGRRGARVGPGGGGRSGEAPPLAATQMPPPLPARTPSNPLVHPPVSCRRPTRLLRAVGVFSCASGILSTRPGQSRPRRGPHSWGALPVPRQPRVVVRGGGSFPGPSRRASLGQSWGHWSPAGLTLPRPHR